jgi:RimJ/RimL family protein N-acetyltransferase
MMYTLQPLNSSFNRAFWSDYARLYNQLLADEPYLTARSAEEYEREIANEFAKDPTTWRAAILRDGELFGYIRSYGFNMTSPSRRVMFEFDALTDRFDDELVELIRETALEVMELRGTDRLLYKTSDKKIHDAFERLGADVAAEVIYFELDMQHANTALMESVMERMGQVPGYSLRFYNVLPDEIIPEFCERFTGFLADMPDYSEASVIDPEEFKVRQSRNPQSIANRFLLFDANERIVGHTNVVVDQRTPETGWQHITGVVSEHRGKGLGLWMKSAMYFRLREDFPELKRVATDTVRSNTYMQHVNAQLGYKPTKEAKEYKLLRSHLLTTVA